MEYRIVDDDLAEPGEEIQFVLADGHGVAIDPSAARTRTWIYDDDFSGAPVLRKATGHDIVYYLSRPIGVAATAGDRPFVLVTPITRSNGAPWAALSEYYAADLGAGEDRFAFDEDGLLVPGGHDLFAERVLTWFEAEAADEAAAGAERRRAYLPFGAR